MNILIPDYSVPLLTTLAPTHTGLLAGAIPGGCMTHVDTYRDCWYLHLCVDDTDISRELKLQPTAGKLALGSILVAAARFAQELGVAGFAARRVTTVEINTYTGTINVELT